MPIVADVADAVIGGDTHKDTHTLEMATPSGVPLASIVVGNDAAGGAVTLAWITDDAPGAGVVGGLEGTRSFGIGLARALRARRADRSRGRAAETRNPPPPRQIRPDRRASGRVGGAAHAHRPAAHP